MRPSWLERWRHARQRRAIDRALQSCVVEAVRIGELTLATDLQRVVSDWHARQARMPWLGARRTEGGGS